MQLIVPCVLIKFFSILLATSILSKLIQDEFSERIVEGRVVRRGKEHFIQLILIIY